MINLSLNKIKLRYLGTVNLNNKYISSIMEVRKHWLLREC